MLNKVTTLFFSFYLMLFALPLHADVTTAVVTPVVSEMVLGDLLQDAEAAANKAISNAENAGNALIANLANQLQVTVEIARINFEGALDKTVGELKEEHRLAFQRLYDLSDEVKSIKGDVYELKDATVLDIRALIKDFPLLDGENYFIQSVTGLSQLKKPGRYQLTINGTGLGPNSEKYKNSIILLMDGKEVDASLYSVTADRANQSHIHINDKAFPDTTDQIIFKQLALQIEVQQKKRLFGFLWNIWDKSEYNLPLVMSLFPDIAGTLEIVASEQNYSWIKTSRHTFSETGGNNHCSKKCKGHSGTAYDRCYSVTGGNKNIVGYERITNVSGLSCSGTCGYDEDQSRRIEGNDSTVCLHWRGRSHPSTYSVSFDIEQYSKSGETKHPAKNITVNYGDVIEVEVPNKLAGAIITGKAITGHEYTETLTSTYNNPFFKLLEKRNGGSKTILVFKIMSAPISS